MSHSTVNKTVGGVTKITTMTRTVTSSSQHQLKQQHEQQQQQQTNQKVVTKVSNTMETGKKDHATARTEDVCVRCNKAVYKMEEVIAEQQIWHKNCFKCNKCDKTLNRHSKVDSFHIREGVVYCKYHFKQLFGAADAPKRRSELIISENQPSELPDNVVRSSKQHDLGLEDIETAAVKRRFRLFEKIAKKSNEDPDCDDDSIHSEDYDDDVDVDLIRAKRAQRERPSNFEAMDEIKNKFEAGMEQSREARNQERKQEIQNIRSKLFTGKLARSTEMYQSALLQTSSSLRNKGSSLAHDMDKIKSAADKAQNIKQQFETGDAYRKTNPDDEDDDISLSKVKRTQQKVSNGATTGQISNKVSERMQLLAKQQAQDKLIRSHAKVKVVEKADIQNQYEFFENYNPEDHNRNEFKENVTASNEDSVVQKAKSSYMDQVKKSKLIKQQQGSGNNENMKNQTKIASNGKKVDAAQNQLTPGGIKSQPEKSGVLYDEAEFEANVISSRRPGYLDSDLEQAKLAARTRNMKDLYERWNYENNIYDTTEYNDSMPEYEEIDESQTETTKTIREKFENLPKTGRIQNTKQPKTNRFVD